MKKDCIDWKIYAYFFEIKSSNYHTAKIELLPQQP